MWYWVSLAEQVPPVEVSPQAAPQPTWEASLVMIREGGECEIRLNDDKMLFTHQFSSSLAGSGSVIGLSKLPLFSLRATVLSFSRAL